MVLVSKEVPPWLGSTGRRFFIFYPLEWLKQALKTFIQTVTISNIPHYYIKKLMNLLLGESAPHDDYGPVYT